MLIKRQNDNVQLSPIDLASHIERILTYHSISKSDGVKTILKRYNRILLQRCSSERIFFQRRIFSYQFVLESYFITLTNISNIIEPSTIDNLRNDLLEDFTNALECEKFSLDDVRYTYIHLGIKAIQQKRLQYQSGKRYDKKIIQQWEKINEVVISLIQIQETPEREMIDRRNISQRTMLKASRRTKSYDFNSTLQFIGGRQRRNSEHHHIDGKLFQVFYGTNRLPIDDGNKLVGYSNNIDTDSLHYGTCNVFIPDKHRPGEISMPWIRKIKRAITLRFDDDEKLVLHEMHEFESKNLFWENITQKLNSTDCRNEALIYIHGFRNTFEDAAIRAAQLGYDLRISGITAFFSWPASNRTFHYFRDGETMAASENSICDFIESFSNQTNIEKVHIIAHSMGNRGLFRVLEKLKSSQKVKFGQIILAAPDLDTTLFTANVNLYTQHADRTTLYLSPKDIAVRLSSIIHFKDRLGFSPPVTVASDVDTILVSAPYAKALVDFGHTYFASSNPLLSDMFTLINNNFSPEKRLGLFKNNTHDKKIYWEMR
jgi:esterase/lipase superfamily enzyme